jgi:hypothetical protein
MDFFLETRLFRMETVGVALQVQSRFYNGKGGDSVSRFDWTCRFFKTFLLIRGQLYRNRFIYQWC